MMTGAENRQWGGQVMISVILGSYNRSRFLKSAIQSIREELHSSPLTAEFIVIDGGSTDGSLPWLLRQKDVITIVQHNRGEWQGRSIERRSWGYFMNLAFKIAQGKYVCMLSDDCLVVPGAIKNGFALAEEERSLGRNIGGIAFYWRNWPEQQKYSVFNFYGVLNVNHGLYLREALAKVGYAEESLYRFYYGDVDLAFSLVHAGYEIIPSKTSFIEHYMHVDKNVRQENFQFDTDDGKNFVDKWQKIYGQKRFSAENRVQVDNIEFKDVNQTASTFARPGRLEKFLRIFKKT